MIEQEEKNKRPDRLDILIKDIMKVMAVKGDYYLFADHDTHIIYKDDGNQRYMQFLKKREEDKEYIITIEDVSREPFFERKVGLYDTCIMSYDPLTQKDLPKEIFSISFTNPSYLEAMAGAARVAKKLRDTPHLSDYIRDIIMQR